MSVALNLLHREQTHNLRTGLRVLGDVLVIEEGIETANQRKPAPNHADIIQNGPGLYVLGRIGYCCPNRTPDPTQI